MSMQSVAYLKIHPGVGIARLGNARGEGPAAQRTDYFVGPVRPGPVAPPPGGYKVAGCVKRQAAEFRVFAYDAEGGCLGEVTAAEARIDWTVTVANTKASWLTFNGQKPGAPRNPKISGPARAGLEIAPGPRSISGAHAGPVRFDSGQFVADPETAPVAVPLGELLTDGAGRLLVLGGHGHSAAPGGEPIKDYANNDGWHDDTSDGRVAAQVTLSDGRVLDAAPSWVICTVPKFAPALENVVTAHDMLWDLWVQGHPEDRPTTTDYWTDVHPVLMRIMNVRWTMGTGPVHAFAVQMAMREAATRGDRKALFDRIRSPYGDNRGLMNMPMLYSDQYVWRPQGDAGFAVTGVIYDHLRRGVDAGAPGGAPPATPGADAPVTPEGMDRAALENACGGPFYPGMEFGWMMRDVYAWAEPFRLAEAQRASVTGKLEPGDVTKQMAVPWQADFLQCRRDTVDASAPGATKAPPEDTAQVAGPVYFPGWWPQHRPDMVTPFGQTVPRVWTRGIGINDTVGFIAEWSKLGFVLERAGVYWETERDLPEPPEPPEPT